MKKFFDKFELIVASITIIALTLLFFIIPDKSFSDKENRALERLPQISGESVASGEYTKRLGRYFADQFPFRDGFVSAKARFELMLAKKENNGVIKAGDILIPTNRNEKSKLKENIECIDNFAKRVKAQVFVAALPRTVDVYQEYLPKSYPIENEQRLWQEYREHLSSAELEQIDVYEELCEQNLYYRTDHHFTTEGAYSVYCAIAKQFGIKAFSEDYFKKETVCRDFCGTSMRTSGFYNVKRDEITLYRYSGDTDYVIKSGEENIPLYDFKMLEATDKYALFLGGNHSEVEIKKPNSTREKLLVIRDSFADSIAPFLALHYDLVYVDLRYYNESVSKLIKSEGINKVLIFECISELSTTQNLKKLMMK